MDEKSARAFFNEQYNKYKSRICGNYTFKFNNNVSRAGVCKFSTDDLTGIIEISRYYLNNPKTTPERLKNTILHEIAHAIAGPDAGHGPVWKRVAREIGCDAERLTYQFRPEHTYKFCLKCPRGCKQNLTGLAKFMLRGGFRCKKHNEKITIYKRNKQGVLMINH